MTKSIKSNWQKYKYTHSDMQFFHNLYNNTSSLDVFVELMKNRNISAFESIAIWETFDYLIGYVMLPAYVITKNTYNLSCNCGCSIIKITKDTDCDYYYLENYALSYHDKQKSLLYHIWNRIKLSFNILIGKEYMLYDIVVDKKDIFALAKWIINKEIPAISI